MMFESVLKSLNEFVSSDQYKTQSVTIVLTCEDFEFVPVLNLDNDHLFYFKDQTEEFLAIDSHFSILSNKEQWIENTRQKMEKIFSDHEIINPNNLPINPRFVGGIAFSQSKPDSTWSNFSPNSFILPNLLFHKSNQTEFNCVLISLVLEKNSIKKIQSLIKSIRKILKNKDSGHPSKSNSNKIVKVKYPVNERQWKNTINKVHEIMDQDNLKKVVLSRNIEIKTEQSIDFTKVIKNLNKDYGECYVFYNKSKDSRFFGASPELLFEIDNNKISTVALAGTSSRGSTEIEDNMLATKLFSSKKERAEHQLVVEGIIESLQDGEIMYRKEPEIMKLSNVLHLSTKISAKFKEKVSVFELIERLHPTPALGGEPRDMAMEFIQYHEPHYRGYYASPLGWIDMNFNSKLIVAIRSALSNGKNTWLYAGAGIMRESDAMREWDEIELKFKPILQALGVVL